MSVCILDLIVVISSVKLLNDADDLPCALCSGKILLNVFSWVFFLLLSSVMTRGFIVILTLCEISIVAFGHGDQPSVVFFWIPALKGIAQFVQRIIAICSGNFLFSLYISCVVVQTLRHCGMLPMLSLSAATVCKRFYPRTGLNRDITSLYGYFTHAQFNKEIIRILRSVNDFMGSGRGCFHCSKALKEKKKKVNLTRLQLWGILPLYCISFVFNLNPDRKEGEDLGISRGIQLYFLSCSLQHNDFATRSPSALRSVSSECIAADLRK